MIPWIHTSYHLNVEWNLLIKDNGSVHDVALTCSVSKRVWYVMMVMKVKPVERIAGDQVGQYSFVWDNSLEKIPTRNKYIFHPYV